MPAQPLILTAAWLFFCILWAARSLVVRRKKRYAAGKKPVDKNTRYKVISLLVYLFQVTLLIPMFWFDEPYLLKFHESSTLSIGGLMVCFFGLGLSVWSLQCLGRNYSPCYDSHEPFQLITTGPYRFIRHPGWLAKWLAGLGTVLVSGSWWFVPFLVWLYVETRRTIRVEERHLLITFPEYLAYKNRTSRLIPFIC